MTIDKKVNILPFYMLRHGQTFANKIRITAGSTNHNLNHSGKLQAVNVAKIFNRLNLKNITFYTSDLYRSQETAFIINKSKYEIVTLIELRERFFGSWEGVKWSKIQKKLKKGEKPKNGETSKDYIDRSYCAFNKILCYNNKSLPFIVGHGGSFLALGKIFNNELIRDIDNCELFHFIPRVIKLSNDIFPWEVKKVILSGSKPFFIKEEIFRPYKKT